MQTSQLPTLLITCPINPSTCQQVILSIPHLPTLSYHLPVYPSTCRPVNLSTSPPIYQVYVHHWTDWSICQPVFLSTPYLPNLNITCSSYPRKPIHPFSCKIFQFTCTVPLNRNIHSSSAKSTNNLTRRPVNLASYSSLIYAHSTPALHISCPVYQSTRRPVDPSTCQPALLSTSHLPTLRITCPIDLSTSPPVKQSPYPPLICPLYTLALHISCPFCLSTYPSHAI